MRIALLGSSQSWYLRDLQRAAGDQHEVLPVPFRALQASVGLFPSSVRPSEAGPRTAGLADVRFQSGGYDLLRADAILVRTMPPGSLEQVVFRMDALAGVERAGIRVLNPPRALETAVDKYLTTARLHAAGLPVPSTVVCQTADDAVAAFHALGRDVVVKPLFGSEGRGMLRLRDEGLVERYSGLLAAAGAVLYLQEFVPHSGRVLRVLVLGQRVLGMWRANPGDWRTNASRGAICSPARLEPSQIDLALRAAAAIGTPLAGVDLLPSMTGETYVLEVNAVPGWQVLSRTLELDVAKLVLALVGQMDSA